MYRILARIFHPNRWNSQKIFTKETAQLQFQDISNAYVRATSMTFLNTLKINDPKVSKYVLIYQQNMKHE